MTFAPRFRFVVFDLDGTLIDSYQALTIALNRSGSSYLPKPFEVEQVRALVGEGVERLLQKAFSIDVVSPELIASFQDEYEKVCCEESRLLDEVEETLRKLHSMSIGMAVCTNKPTSFSKQIIAHLELSRYLPVVVGPDLADARKPDPAHVWYTMEAMGAGREQTLFVGDMPIDVDAARAASVAVATIATGSSSSEELAEREPDFTLRRFSDLVPIVSGVPVLR